VSHVHSYNTRLEWSGSTAGGYEDYPRAHTLTAPPASATLQLSSDAAFAGDPDRLNPEQLVVAAASSCQLLEFLAIAAKARIEVLAEHCYVANSLRTEILVEAEIA
jgi:organic hydroperoxide reductase OsmC/OhrA